LFNDGREGLPGTIILTPVYLVGSTSSVPSPSKNRNQNPVYVSNSPIADYIYETKSSTNIITGLTQAYNTEFHESIEDIKLQSSAYIPPTQQIKVTDAKGDKISIEVPKILAGSTYYTPGTYKYAADSYVPDYEDSVYLSKSLGVVPRKKQGSFLSSTDFKLDSIETPYQESDSLITSNNFPKNNISSTPTISFLPTESSDNRKPFYDLDAKNRTNQLGSKFNLEKTQEELEYENKVAKLLDLQTQIHAYGDDSSLHPATQSVPIYGPEQPGNFNSIFDLQWNGKNQMPSSIPNVQRSLPGSMDNRILQSNKKKSFSDIMQKATYTSN